MLYTFAALPDLWMVVVCNLSITKFDVRLPPLSKCYEISNPKKKSLNDIVIHSIRTESFRDRDGE